MGARITSKKRLIGKAIWYGLHQPGLLYRYGSYNVMKLAQRVLAPLRPYKNYPDELFDGVEHFVLFIGHPRSGSTLVGSLLDAHPNIVISHELDLVPFFQRTDYDLEKIFKIVAANSRYFSERLGNVWTGYNYRVPNQYQGRWTEIRVMGDKAAHIFAEDRENRQPAVDRILETLGERLRLIHVVRNPYDNIGRIAQRHEENVFLPVPKAHLLDHSIDEYFADAAVALDYRQRLPATRFTTVYQEALVEDPQGELRRLCDFLGVPANEDYLRDCASIVFPQPKRSRDLRQWSDAQVQRVEDWMRQPRFREVYERYWQTRVPEQRQP